MSPVSPPLSTEVMRAVPLWKTWWKYYTVCVCVWDTILQFYVTSLSVSFSAERHPLCQVLTALKLHPLRNMCLSKRDSYAHDNIVSKEWASKVCEHLCIFCLCCGLPFELSYLKNAVLVMEVVNATLKIASYNLNFTLDECKVCVS